MTGNLVLGVGRHASGQEQITIRGSKEQACTKVKRISSRMHGQQELLSLLVQFAGQVF